MNYLVNKHKLFKNPECLPLDQVYIAVNKNPSAPKHRQKIAKYPALNKIFIDLYKFPTYKPYCELENASNVDKILKSFIQPASDYIEAIEFLLRLNYHQFWCYLTQDPSCINMLKSYLYRFMPIYKLSILDDDAVTSYLTIHENVLMVLVRIITLEQSPTEYMAWSTVLKLLRQNDLLNFSVMVNIYALYGESCSDLVGKYAKLYFSAPRMREWMNELNKFLEEFKLLLELIRGHVSEHRESNSASYMGIGPNPHIFDPNWYDQAVTCVIDTLVFLKGVLTLCPNAVQIAMAFGIPAGLTYFSSQAFPNIYRVMAPHRDEFPDWDVIQTRIYDRIARARRECVNCFHIFSTFITDRIIQLHGRTIEQGEEFHAYTVLMSGTLDDDLFIYDYHNTFSVEQQMQLIIDFYPDVDRTTCNYLTESFSTVRVAGDNYGRAATLFKLLEIKSPSFQPVEPVPRVFNRYGEPSEEDVDMAIQVVLDALPDYGDGFILRCLKHYNYNPTHVIHTLLEGKIPPGLEDIPTDTIRIPPEPSLEEVLFGHHGKKSQRTDAADLLDDKDNEITAYVLRHSFPNSHLYDDDYDDRDEEEPQELAAFAEYVHPSAYRKNRFKRDTVQHSEPGTSSSDEAAAGPIPDNPRKDTYQMFCENPAKLREERENTWRAVGRRGRGGGQNRDVVGRPRGQGQDTNVQKNRDKKTVNKSSGANHNRKAGAQWKKSKGMY